MKESALSLVILALLALTACAPQPTPPETEPDASVAFDGVSVSASAIAISPDGTGLAAVNPDSGSVTLLSLPRLELKKEITVGSDPRTLTFSADSKLLYVSNFGGNSITVLDVEKGAKLTELPVGAMPYAVIAQKGILYVAEHALGKVSAYDANTDRLRSQLDVEDFPAGLALDADSDILYVTHLFSGKVSLIDLSSFQLEALVSTGNTTNLSQFMLLDLPSGRAYLPQTRSNTTNMQLVFDATVFPVVNVMDLTTQKILRAERGSRIARSITACPFRDADNIPIPCAGDNHCGHQHG